MNGQVRINTDQVLQSANNIENLNRQLQDELNSGKKIVDNLASVWEGEAANTTIAVFDDFANKYFQNYYDIIDQYVKFLRNSVASGYEETEQINISLADSFK